MSDSVIEATNFRKKYGDFTTVDDIQHLFNQLPVPEREVMALRYGCKLNFSAIDAILNSSGEAIRNALRQGRWHAANLERARLTTQN